MTDFTKARQNMVDCQITPNSVINPAVIEAFSTIPREAFVPQALRNVAYMDEDLHIGGGRYLMEPRVHARMLELLAPGKDELVLDVASGCGYTAAILSSLALTVVAIEENGAMLEQAVKTWQALGIGNIAEFKVNLKSGDYAHAPYDKIIINGAVPAVPRNLLAQLKPGGALVALVRKPGAVMGQVMLCESSPQGYVSSRPVFEAGCPYLAGFEPEAAFVF